jgi:hypothetical protein
LWLTETCLVTTETWSNADGVGIAKVMRFYSG